MNEHRERREPGWYWCQWWDLKEPAYWDGSVWRDTSQFLVGRDTKLSDPSYVLCSIPSPDKLEAADRVIEVARQIHATDLGALEELKGLGVDPSPQNSALTTALGVALQGLDATREKS